MATRKQFVNKIKELNATFEETDTYNGKQFFIDAPEGKAWACADSETSTLIGVYTEGWPISETYDDMIERMSHGLCEYHNPEEEK